VEEEASRRHPVPPLRARQLSPGLATLRQLLSALLRAAGAPEEHVEYALAQERLRLVLLVLLVLLILLVLLLPSSSTSFAAQWNLSGEVVGEV